MAKKSMIETNKMRERMSARDAEKRKALKDIVMNKSLPLEERFAAQQKLNELPRNGAKIRVRNRCGITGRPRGYYRKFNLSRICLRTLANQGMLPGVVKASW